MNNPTRSTSIRAQHPGESDHDYLYNTNRQYKWLIDVFFELSRSLESMQRRGIVHDEPCNPFSEQPVLAGRAADLRPMYEGEDEHEYRYDTDPKYALLHDLFVEASGFVERMDREQFTIAECRYAFAPPQFRAVMDAVKRPQSGPSKVEQR